MPGWNVVEKLVEGVGIHCTLVGKFWINSFLILRFLLVTAIAKNSWEGGMVCNTLSPGCKNVCLNEFNPILPVRFWYFQILTVAMTSIVFNIYTTHKLALVSKAIAKKRQWKATKKKEKKELEQKLQRLKSGEDEDKDDGEKKEEKEEKSKDDPDIVATKLDAEQPTKLYISYFFMVLVRILLEVGFMLAQYNIYTFKFVMPELFRCQHWPCPNVVDCFISRPKEKTIMICIFYCTGAIMILLGLLELFQLSGKLGEAWKNRHNDVTKEVFGDEPVMFDQGPQEQRYWADVGGGVYETRPQGFPDVAGIPTLYTGQQLPMRPNKMGYRRKRYR